VIQELAKHLNQLIFDKVKGKMSLFIFEKKIVHLMDVLALTEWETPIFATTSSSLFTLSASS
jgi:hypothetical protein